MSLITRPPSWGFCTTNITGTPAATFGTSVTVGASNADGSAVALLTNLAHDVEYLVVGASGLTAAGDNRSLVDILIDPAGGTTWNTDPLIDDLTLGYSASAGTNQPVGHWFHFPIWIKAGTSIGARGRTAFTSSITGRIIVFAYGGNANPGSWWCGQKVTPIGVNAATSTGTNHTPGVSNAFSSWTDFGSTTPAPCGAVQFNVQGTSGLPSSQSYVFEFGIAGNRIGPPLYCNVSSSRFSNIWPMGPVFCSLPTGTQLQVRAQAATSSVNALDVSAYLVH